MAIRISQIIDSEAAVRDFLKKIAIDIESANSDESFIAVDTEFIRENSDVPLLCLIQIATHTQCFVVDPFAIDISFLNDIFANESILKVFHSATQDIDVLYHANIGVKNVYDTQLYEMLLSTKEFISYKSIVAKYLNRTLNKNYVISDWSKRPLSKKQLQYAVGDVIHLREVYKLQIQKLHDVKRENWLQSEMKQLENLGRELISDKKNAEITKQLFAWIENRSRERNIDSQSIADERTIRRICKKGRVYIQKMLKYRGLINEDFRDFLLFAKEVVPEDIFENPKHNLTTQSLKLILRICAEKNNIAPIIIANMDELADFVHHYEKKDSDNDGKENDSNDGSSNVFQSQLIKGWRGEIFGKYALDFLKEQISIEIKNGNVEFSKR